MILIATSCFIDANVIADWIIINNEVQKRRKQDSRIKYLMEFKSIREEALYSYLLLEAIKSNDKIADHEFCTSLLAIAEAISVTHDRYIAEDLHRKQIPLKYLPKIKLEHHVDSTLKTHKKEISEFMKNFIDANKIKICDKLDIQLLVDIIAKHKIDTYDGFLIAQSINEKCSMFITSDTRLKDFKNNGFRIVKSPEVYNKIKSSLKSLPIIS